MSKLPFSMEDILMQQPKGFKVEGKENFVCRLKMSFIG